MFVPNFIQIHPVVFSWKNNKHTYIHTSIHTSSQTLYYIYNYSRKFDITCSLIYSFLKTYKYSHRLEPMRYRFISGAVLVFIKWGSRLHWEFFAISHRFEFGYPRPVGKSTLCKVEKQSTRTFIVLPAIHKLHQAIVIKSLVSVISCSCAYLTSSEIKKKLRVLVYVCEKVYFFGIIKHS